VDSPLWCEWAWLGGDAATAAVLVAVAGGRIESVTTGVPAPTGAVRLPGLTLPGLVNTHSHAFHRALRGRGQRPGSFWSWRDGMYEVAAALDPDSYFALARAVYAEMALAGITAVGEFHYLHHDADGRPYADPNAMSTALIAAAREAGIRITLLDACYLAGGVGEPVSGVQRRFSDGSPEAWAERVAGLLGTVDAAAWVGVAVHSVRAVPPAAAAVVAAFAREHGLPLHVHLSEQPGENAAALAGYGRTPTAVLAEAGALGGRTTAVHGTHLSEADLRLLARSGTGVCLCPTTEAELADGIGPSIALHAAGVPLSLGSDCHAVIDLLTEARRVELDQRLATGRRGHFTAADLLRMATEHGARSLGWTAGAIRPGALADLTTIGLSSVRLAGADPHSLEAVLAAATAADITHTIVAGDLVVADGRHTRIPDVPAALRAAPPT
jgi:formiminoglutamate deiminase